MIAKFYYQLEKDTRYSFEGPRNDSKDLIFVSVILRSLGILLSAFSINNLFNISLSSKGYKVVSLLVQITLAHDLILTGISLGNEGNLCRGNPNSLREGAQPILNLFKSMWKHGIAEKENVGFFECNFDRFLNDTYLLKNLYLEAKTLHSFAN